MSATSDRALTDRIVWIDCEMTGLDLRADALRVSAARQTIQGGAWVDAPVTAATVQKLEDIILTKARDLRRAAVTD